MRLDIALIDKGYFNSRTQSQEAIRKGLVKVKVHGNWQIIKKPSFECESHHDIHIDQKDSVWVSRAGFKLEGALRVLNLNLTDATVWDIGQSTGGFTEVLLTQGVERVVGVDVGKDQLHESLRNDSRVECFENKDARDLSFLKNHRLDFFTADLSFISLLKVAPEIFKQTQIRESPVQGLFLVKPQFEVGRENIGKGGLVKDPALHLRCEKLIMEGLENIGFQVLNYFPSQLRGKDGNQEFCCFVSADRSNGLL